MDDIEQNEVYEKDVRVPYQNNDLISRIMTINQREQYFIKMAMQLSVRPRGIKFDNENKTEDNK
jgi:hypothetical protein